MADEYEYTEEKRAWNPWWGELLGGFLTGSFIAITVSRGHWAVAVWSLIVGAVLIAAIKLFGRA